MGCPGPVTILKLRTTKITRIEDKETFQKLLSKYVYCTHTSKSTLRGLLGISEYKINRLLNCETDITDEQYEILKKYFIDKIGK